MAQNQTLRELIGPVRSMPVRLTPQRGESFASYVERLAEFHQVPLSTILTTTGLVRRDGDSVVPGWGIVMDDSQLTDFAQATRLQHSAVSALLVKSFQGSFCDLKDVDPRQPSTVQRAAIREWIRFNGSRFCPKCIGMGPAPAWLLRWKLTWSFACVNHASLLSDRCNSCNRFAGLGRGDMTSTPAYLGKILSPGFCRNVPPEGRTGRGQMSMPCGADLRAQQSSTLPDHGRVLAAQMALDREIDAALCRGTEIGPRGDERAHTTAVTLADEARSIASLVLLCGDQEHFCLENVDLEAAVIAHLAKRKGTNDEVRPASGASRRSRAYVNASLEAPLTAAALTPAVEIALQCSHADLVEALLPLARSVRRHTRTTNRQISKDLHFSERLSKAFADASAATGSFGRMSTRYPVLQATQASQRFGPANIPQLMPEQVYRDCFSAFLPSVLSHSGRTFCALAAVKSFGLTWADAAAFLELPQSAARYASTHAMPIVNNSGNGPAFLTAITQWIATLRQRESPTDYAAHRIALRRMDDVPGALWNQTCTTTGVKHGSPGRRSRYAAAWLWSELTEGDWRLSPAIASLGDSASVREVYRRLLTGDLAPALPELLRCAKAELDSGHPDVLLPPSRSSTDDSLVSHPATDEYEAA